MANRSDVWTRVEAKVDGLDTRLDNIDKTLVRQQAILEEHQRRSIANEENVKLLRDEIKPIDKHVAMMNGAGKLITIIGVVAGLVAAIAKLSGL